MDKRIVNMPITVAMWSMVSVCGSSLVRNAGSNPARRWRSVSCGCCVLSGRVLFVGLITRPEESYPV